MVTIFQYIMWHAQHNGLPRAHPHYMPELDLTDSPSLETTLLNQFGTPSIRLTSSEIVAFIRGTPPIKRDDKEYFIEALWFGGFLKNSPTPQPAHIGLRWNGYHTTDKFKPLLARVTKLEEGRVTRLTVAHVEQLMRRYHRDTDLNARDSWLDAIVDAMHGPLEYEYAEFSEDALVIMAHIARHRRNNRAWPLIRTMHHFGRIDTEEMETLAVVTRMMV